jgi:hypothetical protein
MYENYIMIMLEVSLYSKDISQTSLSVTQNINNHRITSISLGRNKP